MLHSWYRRLRSTKQAAQVSLCVLAVARRRPCIFTGAIGIVGLCQSQSRIFRADASRKDAIGQHEPSFNFGSIQSTRSKLKNEDQFCLSRQLGLLDQRGTFPMHAYNFFCDCNSSAIVQGARTRTLRRGIIRAVTNGLIAA